MCIAPLDGTYFLGPGCLRISGVEHQVFVVEPDCAAGLHGSTDAGQRRVWLYPAGRGLTVWTNISGRGVSRRRLSLHRTTSHQKPPSSGANYRYNRRSARWHLSDTYWQRHVTRKFWKVSLCKDFTVCVRMLWLSAVCAVHKRSFKIYDAPETQSKRKNWQNDHNPAEKCDWTCRKHPDIQQTSPQTVHDKIFSKHHPIKLAYLATLLVVS